LIWTRFRLKSFECDTPAIGFIQLELTQRRDFTNAFGPIISSRCIGTPAARAQTDASGLGLAATKRRDADYKIDQELHDSLEWFEQPLKVIPEIENYNEEANKECIAKGIADNLFPTIDNPHLPQDLRVQH